MPRAVRGARGRAGGGACGVRAAGRGRGRPGERAARRRNPLEGGRAHADPCAHGGFRAHRDARQPDLQPRNPGRGARGPARPLPGGDAPFRLRDVLFGPASVRHGDRQSRGDHPRARAGGHARPGMDQRADPHGPDRGLPGQGHVRPHARAGELSLCAHEQSGRRAHRAGGRGLDRKRGLPRPGRAPDRGERPLPHPLEGQRPRRGPQPQL